MATPTKPVKASKIVSVREQDANEARNKNPNNMNGIRQVGLRRHDRHAMSMSERPSTSGGPSPQSSSKREFEKRRAKDGLQFKPLPTPGGVVKSHTLPLSGALPPTPIDTQKTSPPLPQKSSSRLTGNPESVMNGRVAIVDAEQAGIGMALGSPGQQPSAWQTSSPNDYMAESLSTDDYADPYVSLRQKSSKWKLLGGLFAGGKKQNLASDRPPFYNLQPGLVQHAIEAGDYAPSDRRVDKLEIRGRAHSERMKAQTKPSVRRAQTEPMNFNSQNPERERKRVLDGETIGQQGLHHGGLMLNVDIPSVEMERYSVMFGSVLQKPSSAPSSALLARRQATLQKLKTITESLPKEQAMGGDHMQLSPRRASSPQPTKSPASYLFPNSPPHPYGSRGSPYSPQQSRVRRRSNTSPAVPSSPFPISPPRPDYEAQAIPKPKYHISSQMRQPGKEISSDPAYISATQQKIEPVSAREKSLKPFDGSVAKVEDSPNTVSSRSRSKTGESIRQRVQSPLKSAASHSTPESRLYRTGEYSVSVTAMNTPAVTSTSPRILTRKNSRVRSPPPTSLVLSGAEGTVPQQTRTHNAVSDSHPTSMLGHKESETGNINDEEREAKLRIAANVSIARQISVSREQTRLIIPMRSLSTNRDNSPTALTIGQVASPLSHVAAGIEKSVVGRSGGRRGDVSKFTKERLAPPAAKSNIPTLVVVGGDSTEESWGGATVANNTHVEAEVKVRTLAEHRHRKSERVIVESISTLD